MKRSKARTIILDFLDRLGSQEITITMGIGIWTGKITTFDDHSVVLEDTAGISLLKMMKSALSIGPPSWR